MGERQKSALCLTSFNRVVSGGRPELALVSGYSGVGKSSLVHELHKQLVRHRGHFVSGKFDQYKRDIPYAALAQALESLVRPLLAKNEKDLGQWRAAIGEALGPNGQLIVDLVPELKLVIGEQLPVPELPPHDAQNRFQLVFRQFISAFTREHPLVVFVDDLQWVDPATLELIEDLLTHPDVKGLMLIGAYRDNEVGPSHPLPRKMEAVRLAGAAVHDVMLAPLTHDNLAELFSDCLCCEVERAMPLANLVGYKTSGNPFFAIQFFSALAEEELLTFDHGQWQWSWDLNGIQIKDYTDNVIDFMAGNLSRLTPETQKALQQLACLGNSADFSMICLVYQDFIEEMHQQFREAVRAGFILRSEHSYSFLHDRVQEAAYSQIPPELRAETHLRIGRQMAAHTAREKVEENIFEIVNQLNLGSDLIRGTGEREGVARLNLIAGKRAIASTAYASALKYFHAGRSMLDEDTWKRGYELIFPMESLLAECELHNADMDAAEDRLTALAQRARSRHDLAVVVRLQITLYTTLDRSDRAIDVFLDYLRRNGTDWARKPTREVVMHEYDRIWSLVAGREIEDLVGLPLLDDPDVLDMLDVFTEIVHPAMFFDENLSTLVVCRMVNLCLEHGNCDASCFGYVWFGMFAGPRFGNYEGGFRFGQLGYDLVEKRNLTRYQARTYLSFGTLTPWAKHALRGRDLVRRASDVAYRTGDLTFSAYSWHALITNYLAVGDPLSHVQSETEKGLEVVREAGFGLVVENCAAQLALIRTLRGLTPNFGCFDAHDYSEFDTERRFTSNPGLALAEFFYWTRKLQARYFSGDHTSAVESSRRAHQLLWPATSQVETGDFRFYSALAHAAAWNSAPLEERPEHVAALHDHQRQLAVWALHCPANFETKTALVDAEIARIEGRPLDAEHFYETAIRSADENGFAHCEAVANECAAQFYAARGFYKIASIYFRDARDCYLRWGAEAKVRQIEEAYPQIKARKPQSDGGAIAASVQQLDLATVIRVSEAVTGEMDQEKLIDTLMRTAIEHAGAERGLLILVREDGQQIEAEAVISLGKIEVMARHAAIAPTDLPQSVLHYAMRTRERVLLDDASSDEIYSDDEYVQLQRSKSVLCQPIVKQAKLIGALYLENSLTPGAFTPERAAVLELLASQASMSLDNAALYAELQIKVGLLQLIPVSAWTLKPDGTPDFVNRVWLNFAGQTLNFVQSNPEAWMSAIHPDDREKAMKSFWDGVHSGQDFAFETRSLRAQDGTYRWHLQQAVALRDAAGKVLKFVGTTTDIDDQKRTEGTLRQVQADLAHVARVATLNAMTASVAHEVSQPLSGILTNASTCVRMLNADPPNLAGAAETARRMIRDANRAAEVIKRLRAMFSAKAPTIEMVDLNDAAREVIALSAGELHKSRALLQTDFAHDLPLASGDRVQLQQVILNLLLNAADAMEGVEDRPRRILLQTRSERDGNIKLAVRDSGSGVDPHTADKLFEAFYTTKTNGLGVGLSICRSIITSHDGRLWAESTDGPGATFCFCIPSLASG